jgi:hypothetical protein
MTLSTTIAPPELDELCVNTLLVACIASKSEALK